MEEQTRSQAREALDAWSENYLTRDSVVRMAYRSGISLSEIFRRTGLARTTINRILNGDPAIGDD